MKHKSELHARWHRRVEGQIRDCIMKHARWFSGVPKAEKKQFIESLAKRIVGEILADGPYLSVNTSANVAVNGAVQAVPESASPR